ncbi:MAG: HD domain-containing protein [Acidobacteriales bacterium]|nr:HD domain-containing protein [Terriglobales bacterium]
MATTSREAPLGPRFEEALLFAARQHALQRRKASDVPYISHLLGVASLVLEAGGDEDVAISALLHDVVEDCGGRPMLAEVGRRFGPRVAGIVEGCTDNLNGEKPTWRERKEPYLQHLQVASDDERLVSVADKLHNLRSIVADYRSVGESIWQRFHGKRDGTLWYYRSLVAEFGKRPNRLSQELARVLHELEALVGSTGEVLEEQP